MTFVVENFEWNILNLEHLISISKVGTFSIRIQGYPQRMILQRRLYGFDKFVFLLSRFFVGQNWFISVLCHLVNHHHTHMNARRNKLSIVIFVEFWVVFTALSFVDNPVYH